jgi:hypothetical protein
MLARNKNKLTLLLLFAAFLLPVLLSWYLLKFTDVAQNRDKSHHGELIHPVRPLADVGLLDPVTGNEHSLHGKWNLVYHHRGTCLDECRNNLYKLRQLLLATGQYSLRLHRVMIVNRQDLGSIKPLLTEDYAGQLLLFREEVTQEFIDAFRKNSGEDVVSAGRLYIVDPLGNLMMRYDADVDPRGIIKDIQRLIKNSRIG